MADTADEAAKVGPSPYTLKNHILEIHNLID